MSERKSRQRRAQSRLQRINTAASTELIEIKSVQINNSSQSIAGTLRAPKSSLLAMAMLPLCRGNRPSNAEPTHWFPPSSGIFTTMSSPAFV